MGIVIPFFTRDTFLRIMGLNADKNYLTALELAAIADNHLLEPSVGELEKLLAQFTIETESPEAQMVLHHAVRLVQIARSGE